MFLGLPCNTRRKPTGSCWRYQIGKRIYVLHAFQKKSKKGGSRHNQPAEDTAQQIGVKSVRNDSRMRKTG